MIGGITKTKMFSDVRPDTKAFSIIARMKHTHDDGILRSFVKVLEKEGIHIQDSTFLLPNILAQEGCWTKRKPSRTEKADIELGWKLAKEIGRLDIGQCVVVGGGSVLAVEAIDGTDATIMRGGRLGEGKERPLLLKYVNPTKTYGLTFLLLVSRRLKRCMKQEQRYWLSKPERLLFLTRWR